MRKTFILFLALALLLGAVGVVNASTSADKQNAIDAGLAYLNSTKVVSGSQAYWSYYGTDYGAQAATGAALLAFTDQYYKPIKWNGADYSTLVMQATNYLLGSAQSITLTPNWTGVTGTGLIWGGPATNYEESTYVTGLVVPALARLVNNPYGGSALLTPSTPIVSSNPAVNGLTYTQVLQKAIDTMAWGQTGPGNNRYGGWRYVPNSGDSDMSTSQWPVIDFLFTSAPGLGVSVPNLANMKTALQSWIANCQYADGGVDYQPSYGIVNNTHAGGFLLSNFFAGGGGSAVNALNWLNSHWLDGNSSWWGNEGNPYAMWADYKALETLFGTTGAGPITNLHTKTTAIDPGAVWNWWEDYCQWLVLNQNSNGSWNGDYYWTGPMATAWDINILNATRTIVVPLPGTVGLLGTGLFGLLGAGWWRRRKS
jgi:hypothetical protein